MEIKNIKISEINKSLDGLTRQMEMTEERLSDLEEKSTEFIQLCRKQIEKY